MNVYSYKDKVVTIKELSEISGIAPPTLRDRLRRGYSVEQAIRTQPLDDSVVEFSESSWYGDWIGMSTSYLHEIYFKWCISNGHTPINIKGFTRQIMQMHPNLKTVPTRRKHECHRVIRER